MNLDIEQEITARLGAAKQAFQQMKLESLSSKARFSPAYYTGVQPGQRSLAVLSKSWSP